MNDLTPISTVQKVEDGEIICQPGVYDMSIEWYHQQCCDGPSISSSGIRSILRSPAEFWRTSTLNKHRVIEDEKDAYTLGRGAHHLLLGETGFKDRFAIQPEKYTDEKTGNKKAWNNGATVCRDWKANEKKRGRTVLTSAQLERIRGMAGLLPWQKGMTHCGLANTPIVAQGGALSGAIERSLIFKIGNIWVKARPDAIPGDSNDYSDLKTVSPKSMGGIDDRTLALAVLDAGYNVQGAVVGMASKEVLNRLMEAFHLIFVDTGNVHSVHVKTLVDEDIVRGERGVFIALKIFERCLDSGIWPGPTARLADAQHLHLPSWGRERIDRRLDELETEYS